MTTMKQPVRHRFTVDDYEAMVRAGILHEDDRVELIDGEVIEMPPNGPEHQSRIDRHTMLFIRAFGDAVQVRIQGPVRVNGYGQPEPDVALLRPRGDFYQSAHPTPADIFLLIEVSDTTIAYDRRTKAALYGRNSILEYWLLDINQDAVIVHRDPSPDGYRSVQTLRRGDRIALLTFPDHEFAVADLLGDPA
jgi:Uma2 family endonuclease